MQVALKAKQGIHIGSFLYSQVNILRKNQPYRWYNFYHRRVLKIQSLVVDSRPGVSYSLSLVSKEHSQAQAQLGDFWVTVEPYAKD